MAAAPALIPITSAQPAPLAPTERASRAIVRSRLPVVFGTRFFMLLLLGLIWLGPAWWQPEFASAMFVWDLVVLLAWIWDARQLPRPEEIEVRRSWIGAPSLSLRSQARLEVANHGRTAIKVTLVDDVVQPFRAAPPEMSVAVAPRESESANYEIQPGARGDCKIGDVYLRYQSRLGIAERWAVAPLSQTLRVYPNLQEAKRHTIYLIRSRQIEMERRRKRRRGMGREFESLREYRDGDERRDIFWPGTARRGKLITKVYQIERSQAVWLVVDAGRLMRARVAGLTKLDYAVNAALALAHIAMYSGDRVGLLAYGRNPQFRLAPNRGPLHLRAMLDQLALVSGEAGEGDHLRAAELLLATQKQRALVVWLTDLAETAAMPDVIESAMQISKRHLILFAAIAQPELAQTASSFPADVPAMYRHVVATEMVQRREALLRSVRQRGGLALEIPPGKLTTSMVNQYLEVKERGLL